MKNLFIQYGRWFVLAFVLGFLLPRANPTFFQADVTNIYNKYSLEDALVEYHLMTNTVTNTYLKLLTDPNSAKLGYVEYPSDDSQCDGKNVSTYCLAVVLNNNLSQFEESMTSRVGTFDLENGDFNTVTDLHTALQQASSQQEVIQSQVSTAEDALDLALAVYNQIQTVYPLHIELTKFYDNLQDYSKNLSTLRHTLSAYPSKFNGATSSDCK